jgi:hypothetical protein
MGAGAADTEDNNTQQWRGRKSRDAGIEATATKRFPLALDFFTGTHT